MKIRIESYGGIGNIRIKGELALDSLPVDLQKKLTYVLKHLDTSDNAIRVNQDLADGMGYNLTFVSDNSSKTRFVQLSEAIHDKEMMQIGKSLLHEVIKRRKKQ